MPDLLSISTWRNIATKHGSKVAWAMILVMGGSLVISYGTGFGRYGQQHGGIDLEQQIATVNGTPITLKEFQAASGGQTSEAGEQQARAQGSAMANVVASHVVQEDARSRNVSADDAEIDKNMTELHDNVVGKTGDEQRWHSFLQSKGVSQSELRDQMAKQLVVPALLKSYGSGFKFTEEDAKNQTAEVKLKLVLIRSTEKSPFPAQANMPKPLPEAEAKKQAESLLAKVKAGEKIADIAKKFSGDFSSKNGGDLGWRGEYKLSQMGDKYGSLNLGADFDTAVRATKKGELTAVAKIGGFTPGYGFALVEDRRNNLPKDFDAKKVVEELKSTKAQKIFAETLRKKTEEAKVEISDPTIKAHYAFYKIEEARNQEMMEQMGQGTGKVATPADIEKLEADALAQYEALLAKQKGDPSLSLIIASLIKPKLTKASTPLADRDKIRERLITLYEDGLKGTDSPTLRKELAEYYHDRRNFDKAAEHYRMASRLMTATPPTDVASAQNAVQEHQMMLSNIRNLNKPDLIASEMKVIDDLGKELEKFKAKEEIERKIKAAADKNKPKTPAPTGLFPTKDSKTPAPKPDTRPAPSTDKK